jgi:hypothetical protein
MVSSVSTDFGAAAPLALAQRTQIKTCLRWHHTAISQTARIDTTLCVIPAALEIDSSISRDSGASRDIG